MAVIHQHVGEIETSAMEFAFSAISRVLLACLQLACLQQRVPPPCTLTSVIEPCWFHQLSNAILTLTLTLWVRALKPTHATSFVLLPCCSYRGSAASCCILLQGFMMIMCCVQSGGGGGGTWEGAGAVETGRLPGKWLS